MDFGGGYRVQSRRDFAVWNFQEEMDNAFPMRSECPSGCGDHSPVAEDEEDGADALGEHPKRRFIPFPDGFCHSLHFSG
jgi:hypothetical protein